MQLYAVFGHPLPIRNEGHLTHHDWPGLVYQEDWPHQLGVWSASASIPASCGYFCVGLSPRLQCRSGEERTEELVEGVRSWVAAGFWWCEWWFRWWGRWGHLGNGNFSLPVHFRMFLHPQLLQPCFWWFLMFQGQGLKDMEHHGTWWNNTIAPDSPGQEEDGKHDDSHDGGEKGDDPEEPAAECNEAEVCHIFEAVQSDVALSKELVMELKDHAPNQVKTPKPDDEPEPAEDSDVENKVEAEPKKAKSGGLIRGLADVLAQSGLDNFVPEGGEAADLCLARLRKMGCYMQSFTALVRCKEAILSRASILGEAPSHNPHHVLEFDLAEARAEYHCTAQRQSRFALWADFGERAKQVLEGSLDKDESSGARPINLLHPNCCLDPKEEHRACQVLLARPFMNGGELGPCRLVVVTGVWRGAKSQQKKSKDAPYPGSSLPISAATKIHGKALFPEKEVDDQKWHLFTATGRTPVFCLDAHDGSLVMEIPPDCFRYTYKPDCLEVWLSPKSIKCVKTIMASNLPFVPKKKHDGATPTFFTEEDFAKSGTGTNKNIAKCINAMRHDQEVHFGQFVEKDHAQTVKLRRGSWYHHRHPNYSSTVWVPGYPQNNLGCFWHWGGCFLGFPSVAFFWGIMGDHLELFQEYSGSKVHKGIYFMVWYVWVILSMYAIIRVALGFFWWIFWLMQMVPSSGKIWWQHGLNFWLGPQAISRGMAGSIPISRWWARRCKHMGASAAAPGSGLRDIAGHQSFVFFGLDFLPRFGKLVLMELQRVAPQPGDEASKFPKFLIKVFRESEAPLKLESWSMGWPEWSDVIRVQYNTVPNAWCCTVSRYDRSRWS